MKVVRTFSWLKMIDFQVVKADLIGDSSSLQPTLREISLKGTIIGFNLPLKI